MADNYDHIAYAFCHNEPMKKGWYSRTHPGNPPRLGLDSYNADILSSYGHYPLGFRHTDKAGRTTILVNGDNGPSNTTNKQRRALISAAEKVHHAILPFSALGAAGIRAVNFEDIAILEITAAKYREVWQPCRAKKCYGHTKQRSRADGGHDWAWDRHFLGETLFKFKDRLYVCGLDRNDRVPHFYLAQLPKSVRVKTVEAALQAMRPEAVPEDALRQGEWFFVPAPELKPRKKDVATHIMYDPAYRTEEPKRIPGVPILSHVSKAQLPIVQTKRAPLGRLKRHVASRMYVNGAVYVAGRVRDDEHTTLPLGDGKTWYRVVRNRVTASWGATGQVD